MMSGALTWRQGLLQAKTGIGTPEGGEPHLPNVGFGSKADENGPSAPGLLSDLKLTQFGVNRTLGHEGLLSGRQRKSERRPLNSRS